MSLNLESHVTPADVLLCEIGAEAVLVSVATGSYHKLDRLATRMWKALVTHPQLRCASSELCAEYEVEPERLEADLLEFVKSLEGKGLVVVERLSKSDFPTVPGPAPASPL